MWCFVVRSAQGARILNPLMLLATPRMRTSAGADFPLMLSTSSSTNNHYLITLTKPFSSIPCTLNFLIIHTHRSNLHYHPRTWAEHQLPFGGSCARACTLVAAFRMKVISANGHLGSSPLQQRRILERVVFVLQMKFYICFTVVD